MVDLVNANHCDLWIVNAQAIKIINIKNIRAKQQNKTTEINFEKKKSVFNISMAGRRVSPWFLEKLHTIGHPVLVIFSLEIIHIVSFKQHMNYHKTL